LNKKMTKTEAAWWLCGAWVLFIGVLIKSIQVRDWSGVLFSLAVVIGIPTVVVVAHTPATCGVITRARRPCPNPSGVIFGCGNAKHHTWRKVFQRFGIVPESVVRPSKDAAETMVTTAGARITAPLPVKVVADGRETVLFWMSFGEFLVGVLSLIVTAWPILVSH
jgi:hypothetical protein